MPVDVLIKGCSKEERGRFESGVGNANTMVKEFLMTVLHMEKPRPGKVACGIEHIIFLEEISKFELITDHVRKC